MEYNIEFGPIADAYGKLPAIWGLMLDGIPHLAKTCGLELDIEKSRWHTHHGRKRGGLRYVRYVAVAPAGADKTQWQAKVREFETYLRIKLRDRNPHKR